MIKNIFKLGLRNFFSNKIYSFAIIISLITGLTVSNLLIGFIVHELETDSQYNNKSRIYRLVGEDPFGRSGYISYMLNSIPEYIKNHYAEIEKVTQINTITYNGITTDHLYEPIDGLVLIAVDTGFLEIFDFELAEGSKSSIIGKGNIVLTRESSEMLFGKNPLPGKIINLLVDSVQTSYHVSGIIEKQTTNSHLAFDGLLFCEDFKNINGGICYVLLQDYISSATLVEKINSDQQMPSLIGPGKGIYALQPLTKVYFDVQNSRNFSKARNKDFIFIGIGITLTVLALAGFNFISLFSNSLIKRWKEFGLKKVLGAGNQTFLITALVESVVYVGLAFIISLGLCNVLITQLNVLAGSNLSMAYYSNFFILSAISGILVILVLVAIIRISGYLNRIKPIHLLSNKNPGKAKISQAILSLQFIISIVLIVASIVVIKQSDMIKSKSLGFNRNIMEVRSPRGANKRGLSILKNRIEKFDGVESVSICGGNPISDNMIFRYDLDDGSFYTPYYYEGDENYVKTLGLTLLEGQLPVSTHGGKLVNQAFVKYFDFKNPLGTKIPGTENDYIIGIVKDFHIGSFKEEIPPAILSYTDNGFALLINFQENKFLKIKDYLKSAWNEAYPFYSFRYLLMDDELSLKHEDDFLFSKMILVSSFLSILISCIGLFALSWGNTQQRTREFGIRKVIGASPASIMRLLIIQMLKSTLIAFIIAVPLSYYLVSKWLSNFAYKIDLSVWIFILAGMALIGISFFTISYHIIKSARTNPVEELRYE